MKTAALRELEAMTKLIDDLSSADFFSKLTFFKQYFQEHFQSVKQFGSRLKSLSLNYFHMFSENRAALLKRA